jgi:hypothetical protein
VCKDAVNSVQNSFLGDSKNIIIPGLNIPNAWHSSFGFFNTFNPFVNNFDINKTSTLIMGEIKITGIDND